MSRLRHASLIMLAVCQFVVLSGQGCPAPILSPGGDGASYNNTTDPTNGGASYLGSATCKACHPETGAKHALHGHAHILNQTEGQAPAYPSAAGRAVVPVPPAGYAWSDIAYVLGGYVRKAKFIDRNGFLLAGGAPVSLTQWNLAFPANETAAGFVSYEPATAAPTKPYEYSCFVCHATGPQPQDPGSPRSQENRPGIVGTWEEAGVQCESCHGPGSNHPATPSARTMYVNASASACGACHGRPRGSDGTIIQAKDGFIRHHEQYPELLASGGHASFACTICHDPHSGTTYDRANGIRNDCTVCHWDKNMALHEEKVYVRGDYVEFLTCASCHMPYATRNANSAVVGQSAGRVGDMRTHIFRINTDPVNYTAMFSLDLSEVRKDAAGRASVTLDFVCLRCHNTENGYPFRLTLISASDAAPGLHGLQ